MIGLMSSQGEELFSDDDGPAMEIHKSMTKTDLPNSDSDPEIFRKAKRKREASLPQKAEIEAKPDPFSRVGRPSAAPQLSKNEGQCPVLWCGRRHDKSVVLAPDQWITLGKERCTVRLPDKKVSSHHCQLRWSSQFRQVQFVDTSTNGTWVSGEKVRQNRREPRILEHGAKIVVEAESSSNFFSFLLDLRKAGLAFTDPRQLPRGVDPRKQELERDKWKKHLLELRLRRDKQETEILQKEKLFYELQTQRHDIDSRCQTWQSEVERLKTETEAILSKMLEKRQQWKDKLQQLYKEGEAAAVPLTEKTIQKQDEVAKLEMRVTEMEREIYPDRFALAELPEDDKVKGMEETDEEQDGPASRPTDNQDSSKLKSISAQQPSSGYAPTTPAKTPAPEDSGAYQPDSAPAVDSAKFAEEVLDLMGDQKALRSASAEVPKSAPSVQGSSAPGDASPAPAEASRWGSKLREKLGHPFHHHATKNVPRQSRKQSREFSKRNRESSNPQLSRCFEFDFPWADVSVS